MKTGNLFTFAKRVLQQRNIARLAVLVFIVAGSALFLSTLASKAYSQEQLVWDLQWMNAWTLVFCFLMILIWRSPGGEYRRRWMLLVSFSFWAVVTYSLLYNGTPFSWGAYWGDQKFRQAMILKFMTFAVPGDFYYKDLPPFYPPLYYYLLAILGRLASIDYYHLLKVGTQLIYLLSPFVLYSLWSTIVSRFQAMLVAIATVVICGICYNLPVAVPHEFVANALFVPWWLAYIEGVGRSGTTKGWYLAGGLLGGAIFCTYYYAFFVGALILLIRMLLWPLGVRLGAARSFQWVRAITVMVLSAVVSSAYWLPVIISMVQYGSDPAQREYFHIGHAEMEFSFTKISWAGLLLLSALLYSVRRRPAPVHRAMVVLVAGILGYFVIGYILGNLGEPILYVRSNELLMVVGGAMIGLVSAAALRLQRVHGTGRGAIGIALLVGFVTFAHIFTSSINVKQVKTAREAKLMDWNTDPVMMRAATGKVFLTEHELLPSFFPVYVFNAINQQYAHHASRYDDRFRLLHDLQFVTDPTLFYLGLRYNKYDVVDYFMPGEAANNFQLNAVLSNYPKLFYHKILKYDRATFEDGRYFMSLPGDHLYKVSDEAPLTGSYEWPKDFSSTVDSILFLYRLRLVASHLTDQGGSILNSYLQWDTDKWHVLPALSGDDCFGSGLSSVRQSYLIEGPDSLYVVMAFMGHDEMRKDTRPFLHAYPAAIRSETFFDNIPFRCQPPMGQWEKGDVIVCYWSLPLLSRYNQLIQGFVTDSGRLGSGCSYDMPQIRNR